jgi:Rieske Fe-S protein
VPRFRNKPIATNAILWSGDNFDAIVAFMSDRTTCEKDGSFLILHIDGIRTVVEEGEWIVEKPFYNIKKTYVILKPDVFDGSYDQVPEVCTACGCAAPNELHPHFLCDICIRNP